jgi:hypothetical protein
MNRHSRRASGTQHQKSASEAAAADLARRLPEGYRARYVQPPWHAAPPGCRSCGGTTAGKWTMAMLTRTDAAACLVRFAFATVCPTCFSVPRTMANLAARVFGPEST